MRKLLFTVLMLLPFIVIGQTTEKVGYYESGAVKFKVYNLDGVKQGEEISYFESGAIQTKFNYVDGVLINNK